MTEYRMKAIYLVITGICVFVAIGTAKKGDDLGVRYAVGGGIGILICYIIEQMLYP
jgi:hypothetical protein